MLNQMNEEVKYSESFERLECMMVKEKCGVLDIDSRIVVDPNYNLPKT